MLGESIMINFIIFLIIDRVIFWFKIIEIMAANNIVKTCFYNVKNLKW